MAGEATSGTSCAISSVGFEAIKCPRRALTPSSPFTAPLPATGTAVVPEPRRRGRDQPSAATKVTGHPTLEAEGGLSHAPFASFSGGKLGWVLSKTSMYLA